MQHKHWSSFSRPTCTDFNDNKRHSFAQTVLLKTSKSFLLQCCSISLKTQIIKHPYVRSSWMVLPRWTRRHCISEPQVITNIKVRCFRRNWPYLRTDRRVDTLQEMYAAVTLDNTIVFKTSFLQNSFAQSPNIMNIITESQTNNNWFFSPMVLSADAENQLERQSFKHRCFENNQRKRTTFLQGNGTTETPLYSALVILEGKIKDKKSKRQSEENVVWRHQAMDNAVQDYGEVKRSAEDRVGCRTITRPPSTDAWWPTAVYGCYYCLTNIN